MRRGELIRFFKFL